MRVTWDEAKNLANRNRHDLSFEEARELLLSEDYVEIYDADHSISEERFIAIGPIDRGLILVVWTERDENTTRIISARFATRRERGLYRDLMDERL